MSSKSCGLISTVSLNPDCGLGVRVDDEGHRDGLTLPDQDLTSGRVLGDQPRRAPDIKDYLIIWMEHAQFNEIYGLSRY